MPRPITARSRTGAKARRGPQRRPDAAGWRTTDEEEIERRRLRAAEEPIEIEALEPAEPRFGTFRAGAAGGRSYLVEIRSLERFDNSCDCPDYQVNGLGFCKHVAAVLAAVGRSKRPGARRGNARIEVFLRRWEDGPRVRVQWPAGGAEGGRALVEPFFDAGGELVGDPLAALPALARRLEQAPPRRRRQVRLSRHLQPWIEERRRRAARPAARERFLAEVAAGRRSLDPVKRPLYPYQREGMLHLAFTERALLADEMGLGKTVQAIAACELLRQIRGIERVLVVSPASLKAEWQEQIALFTDLPARLIEGPRAARLRQYGPGAFFYLAHYEQVLVDGDDLVRRLAPDVVVLDEAQRIKNWRSKTAHAVKRLASPYAFVLTGTPLENRIDEIYSLVQFLDPGLLGPLFRFNREFYALDERGRPEGTRNLGELHRRLRPVLLRRRKDEVEGELPERTAKTYFVPMEAEQATRYDEYERRVAQLVAISRRRPLTPDEFDKLQRYLASMRMICDTPYILDSDCRVCPKLAELREILEERLAEPGTKILVFSEWERMLELVRELAVELGAGFAWHTGSVPLARRRQEVRRFKEDPGCRLFLSTDSGGVGLNLQAANVVVNLDLPWNPARLEQRIARAWRKHQTRPVAVVHLVTELSIEHRMMPLLAHKLALADRVLDGRGDFDDLAQAGGRAAFMARVAAVLAPPRPAAAPAGPARGSERLRDDLLARYGDGLLRLELRADPARGETVLAVLARADEAARADVAARLARHFAGTAAPALEICDGATFAALERLAAAGIVELTAPGEVLHGAGALSPAAQADDERRRRAERAREAAAPAARKIRMAAVLAAGGFPVEALAPLREGVEAGFLALATLEAAEPPAGAEVAGDWIAAHLARHPAIDAGVVALAAKLRSGPETLLLVGEDEARTWIAAGERFAAELAATLDRET
jgi:superfamily II DNA or RNA helicase